MRVRTVVVLTGLPGTGKSTLADLLAREAGSPAFAGDWLQLAPGRAGSGPPTFGEERPAARSAY